MCRLTRYIASTWHLGPCSKCDVRLRCRLSARVPAQLSLAKRLVAEIDDATGGLLSLLRFFIQPIDDTANPEARHFSWRQRGSRQTGSQSPFHAFAARGYQEAREPDHDVSEPTPPWELGAGGVKMAAMTRAVDGGAGGRHVGGVHGVS